VSDMTHREHDIRRRRLAALLPAALAALFVAGCVLDEPELDERWTLVEFLSMSPQPQQNVNATQPINVSVKGRITYRRIVTGFLVAEVRYSDTISPQNVALATDEHTLAIAQDVDRILANSVSTGRATRAVTGFDHLMQDVNFTFTAQVPAALSTPGAPGGLYLVMYMGEGEEIELQNGADSLVVTPFVSTNQEILHTGFTVNLAGTP
jgi:hypothetical protein